MPHDGRQTIDAEDQLYVTKSLFLVEHKSRLGWIDLVMELVEDESE